MVLPAQIPSQTAAQSPVLKPADNVAENSSKSNQSNETEAKLQLATDKMFGSRSPLNFEQGNVTPERPAGIK